MYNEQVTKNNNDDDSDDNSDHNLKIVIESPQSKRKCPPKPSISEKLIIQSIEDELETRLEEKVAKTNLNVTHVKNIIKQVVTNEHVIALVKKAENPTGCNVTIPYEVKFTRAKAKELLSSIPVTPIPWGPQKTTSEVQVLFTGDLQEDSSGDEYIPGEEESEDDRDSSIISDPPSVRVPTPPTPSKGIDSGTQTNWTDDGIFKIPPNKSKEDVEEDTNISRRTRSKLCLTSTPLETIEEAFIPPDITTDMYDMDCDNDDWMDFLKKFTRPLDEITKPTEDEEQDPEYNILADEEIDKIDAEELRVDKAVKVTRKELNELITELLEYSEVCDDLPEVEKKTKNMGIEHDGHETLNSSERVAVDATKESAINPMESITQAAVIKADIDEEDDEIIIKRSQIPLLEQQMRQHVQILTQNFILTYQHPEFHHFSLQAKEYLLNLKFLCDGKKRSAFYTVNLINALELIKYWEDLHATNNDDFKEMTKYVEDMLWECTQNHGKENFIFSFPKLILETISKSDVFLYPSLLPKMPFKPTEIFSKREYYTDSENRLVALGLEQFETLLKRVQRNVSKSGEVQIKTLCSYIQEYMMPHKDAHKIAVHINTCKHQRCANNPIKYYFQQKKAPPVVHFIKPLHELQILPPCARLPDQLPEQWKNFNFPHKQNNTPTPILISSVPSFNLSTATVIPTLTTLSTVNGLLFQPQIAPLALSTEIEILPKKIITSTPIYPNKRKTFKPFKKRKLGKNERTAPLKFRVDPITKFVECLSRPSVITKLQCLYSDTSNGETVDESNTNLQHNCASIITDLTMLPSMPTLGTPIKKNLQNEVTCSTSKNANTNEECNTTVTNSGSTRPETRKNALPEISTISSSSFEQAGASTEVEFYRPDGNCQTVTSTCKGESGIILENSSNQESLPINIPNPNSTQNENVKESTSNSLEKSNPDIPNAIAKPPTKKEPSGAEKKRAKMKKEFLANLSVTAPEDPEIQKQKDEMFALAYYDKMRESLDIDDYHKVMQILNDHEDGDAVDLYRKIEKILNPKYQELANEFLLFLREKEAAAVGQLVPWIKINNRSKFLRKLEIYFKDQPAQLRRIYKCLTELSQTLDVSMEKIKTTLLPMFKGNALLTDLFLQNFCSERPPPSLLEGPYETIDVAKELSRPDEEPIYETVTIPDTEDKYGGSSCICNCHEIEDPDFKSRYRHCIRCGTRFINGKVFIQSGRGLRPATVSFLNNSKADHNTRLLGKNPIMTCLTKKRSDRSPSKLVPSPPKENLDEETEDEIDRKKKTKRKYSKRKPSDKTLKVSKGPRKNTTPKRSKSPKGSKKFENTNTANKEYKTGGRKRTYSAKKSKDDEKKTDSTVEEKVVTKPGAVLGQQKRLADESMEWEDNPENASVPIELKANSPDPQTAESESEFCEESSQDNCESDSNSSISSLNNQSQSDSNAGEECSWKRQEDKIILETFQKENDKEHAFEIIAKQLKNRTVSQINSRFQTLMTLLLETLGSS